MSKQTIVKCDRCGKEKQEVNRWFRMIRSKDMQAVGISTFDSAVQFDGGMVQDFCSEACTIETVQVWMKGFGPQAHKEKP